MSGKTIALIAGVAALVIILIVVLIVVFTGGGNNNIKAVPISLWGPFPPDAVQDALKEVNSTGVGFNISYTALDPRTYENDITEALAAGAGPDLWFVTQENITRNMDKIFPLPFSAINERFFADTFANATKVFVNRSIGGVAAMPAFIDPIMLYRNTLLFSSAGIASPPESWGEYLSASRAITKREGGTITVSGSAMGEHRNITNATDIISMIILQLGDSIIDIRSGAIDLGNASNAVDFYTEFSDPAKDAYSWNRSLPESKTYFTNALLGMYFGYASELPDVADANPHLEFDIARVPQIEGGDRVLTMARVYGIAISKLAPDKSAAARAVVALTGESPTDAISRQLSMAPARRALLGAGNDDPNLAVIYRSAVSSRTWLEPDPDGVDTIWRGMVEEVSTGRSTSEQAVRSAKRQLRALQK